MGGKIKDKVGQRFGKVVVIRLHHQGLEGRSQWLCKCDCGKTRVIHTGQLHRRGNVRRSCGCTVGRKPTHGLTKSVEYKVWLGMRNRCYKKTHHKYDLYGKRGVRVCREWKNDFLAFYNYIGPKPTPKHSLDRKDNDKGYRPGNVRWATILQQRHNQRRCK